MENTKDFKKKLRLAGLRPTKQRINICEVLFNRDKTFHFTISDLVKMIQIRTTHKVSLATVYNTVHSFKKKGYLKEIAINSSQSYFDTNITDHHHFYDEKQKQLVDLENKDIDPIKIKRSLEGKKIQSIEVLVRVDKK